jgi:hypothetical protein
VRKSIPIPQLLDTVDDQLEFPTKSIQEWKNQVEIFDGIKQIHPAIEGYLRENTG